jgi:hypothetical protein
MNTRVAVGQMGGILPEWAGWEEELLHIHPKQRHRHMWSRIHKKRVEEEEHRIHTQRMVEAVHTQKRVEAVHTQRMERRMRLVAVHTQKRVEGRALVEAES